MKALEESYTENLGPNQKLLEKLSEKQEEHYEPDPKMFESEEGPFKPNYQVSEGRNFSLRKIFLNFSIF